MNLRIAVLTAIFSGVWLPFSMAGSKPGEAGMVTFHLETDTGGSAKMTFPQMDNGKQRFFLKLPEFSMKDIVAFKPFPSGNNDAYGLVFQLKDHGRRHLNAMSIANQGKFLLAQANGRIVDGVMIDKQVDDGLLVIWKGITLNEIKLFDKVLPRIGDKGKKKKASKAKT